MVLELHQFLCQRSVTLVNVRRSDKMRYIEMNYSQIDNGLHLTKLDIYY